MAPNTPQDTRTAVQSGDGWFLRLDDNTVFGPVELSALVEWAEQGRVLPGHQISRDGSTWKPAEDLPALRMEWMMELPDRTTYGPLNLHALAEAVREGSLHLSSKIQNRHTGETSTVAQLMNQIAGPAPKRREAPVAPDAAPPPTAAPSQPVQAAKPGAEPSRAESPAAATPPPVSAAEPALPASPASPPPETAAAADQPGSGVGPGDALLQKSEVNAAVRRAVAAEEEAATLRQRVRKLQDLAQKTEEALRGELRTVQSKMESQERDLKAAQDTITALKSLDTQTEIDWINQKKTFRAPAERIVLAEKIEMESKVRRQAEELGVMRHEAEQRETEWRAANERIAKEHAAALDAVQQRLHAVEARAAVQERQLRQKVSEREEELRRKVADLEAQTQRRVTDLEDLAQRRVAEIEQYRAQLVQYQEEQARETQRIRDQYEAELADARRQCQIAEERLASTGRALDVQTEENRQLRLGLELEIHKAQEQRTQELAAVQTELQKAQWAAEHLDEARQKVAMEKAELESQLQQNEMREKQQRGLMRGLVGELRADCRKLELALEHQKALHAGDRERLGARIAALEEQIAALSAEKATLAEQVKTQSGLREREQRLREARELEAQDLRRQMSRLRPTEVAEPEVVRVPPKAESHAYSLAGLEAQAQRELRAWRESRRPPATGGNPVTEHT
jgi:hypothetical protein